MWNYLNNFNSLSFASLSSQPRSIQMQNTSLWVQSYRIWDLNKVCILSQNKFAASERRNRMKRANTKPYLLFLVMTWLQDIQINNRWLWLFVRTANKDWMYVEETFKKSWETPPFLSYSAGFALKNTAAEVYRCIKEQKKVTSLFCCPLQYLQPGWDPPESHDPAEPVPGIPEESRVRPPGKDSYLFGYSTLSALLRPSGAQIKADLPLGLKCKNKS